MAISRGRVSPWAGMPSSVLSWLAAMMIAEAEMKPEITGWLRKFARKPRRSTPSTSNISPDSNASTRAAVQ